MTVCYVPYRVVRGGCDCLCTLQGRKGGCDCYVPYRAVRGGCDCLLCTLQGRKGLV